MSTYSHSQIQTYLTCPLKYKYEKIDEYGTDIVDENLHLILGSSSHNSLEWLYNQVSNYQIPSIDKLLNKYKENWKKQINTIIEKYDENPFDKKDTKLFFQRGQEYMKYYYNNYKPFDQAITMQTEQNIYIDLGEGIKFRGKIDRLDINDNTLIVNDYKTSKSLPQDKYSTVDDQLALYSLGIKQNYGKKIKKIYGKVIYLHLQNEFEWEMTDDILTKTKDKYLSYAKEIENKKEMLNDKNKEKLFPAQKNNFCSSCGYQMLCPLFSHSSIEYDDAKIDFEDMDQENVRKFIDKFIDIQTKAKEFDKQKKFYTKILSKYAQKNDFKRLYGTNKKITLVQRDGISINKDKLDSFTEYLKEKDYYQQAIKIDKHAIQKLIDKDKLNKKEIKDYISEYSYTYFTSASEIK